MYGHRNQQKTKKNKILALPIVPINFSGDLGSSVEKDIKFYGIVPLTEITRDPNLFVVQTPVASKIRIIPIGDANPVNVIWSWCFYDIHRKTLRELVNFVSSQGLGDVTQYGILCVGYEQDGVFDLQLGVTGGVDGGETPTYARDREILEECGVITTWSWGRNTNDTCGWRKIDWTGYIVGVGDWSQFQYSRWNAGCTCPDLAIMDGWECCASGFGRCAPLTYEIGDINDPVFSRFLAIIKIQALWRGYYIRTVIIPDFFGGRILEMKLQKYLRFLESRGEST